jgi:hypothetical protein
MLLHPALFQTTSFQTFDSSFSAPIVGLPRSQATSPPNLAQAGLRDRAGGAENAAGELQRCSECAVRAFVSLCMKAMLVRRGVAIRNTYIACPLASGWQWTKIR